MLYLNVGCGNNFHPDWINIDIVSTDPHVTPHDLTTGIPLPDNMCQVVYHSHVLEHLRRTDAYIFMQECYRVLKPGGILRVAVPDLEQICRLYLKKLDLLLNGSADFNTALDYEWMMLELYDQVVRERSGGQMLSYLSQVKLTNKDFILERIGDEGRALFELLERKETQEQASVEISRDVSSRSSHWMFKKNIYRGFTLSLNKLRDFLIAAFLGESNLKAFKLGHSLLLGFIPQEIDFLHKRALGIGQFRLSGEVHQWMYDKFSLKELLKSCGFQELAYVSPLESRIHNWSTFNLDTTLEGKIRKPDSLFIEAVKSFTSNVDK